MSNRERQLKHSRGNRAAYFSMLFWLSTLPAHSIEVRAAPPLEAYGGLPQTEIIQLSPSGERYALVGVVGEKRRFVTAPVGGAPDFALDMGDNKVFDIEWADETHVLIMIHSTLSEPLVFRQDHEVGMVVVVNLQSRKAFVVFENSKIAARLVRGYFGSWRVNDRLYGFFAGMGFEKLGSASYDVRDGFRDLFRVDLDTGQAQSVQQENARVLDWVVGAEGTRIAHSHYLNKKGLWKLFGASSRDMPLIEEPDPQADIELLGSGRSPGTVAIHDGRESLNLVREISLEDGARTDLLADTAPFNDVLRDRDSRLMLGARTAKAPYARFFDQGFQTRYESARNAFPGREAHLASFSRNLDRLIVMTDGADDSGTYWLVDMKSHKAEPIAHLYPEIRPADVASTEWFEYTASDGLAIQAVLTLPAGRTARNLPLVVLPHPGPDGELDRVGFDWWAQAFASRGYAVLQPNYRGSDGYGKAFRDAGKGEWGKKMQSDLSDGVAALAAQGRIDPKRACIVGLGYGGGYPALAGVTLQQRVYRCSVAVAAPSNLPRLYSWLVERYGYPSHAERGIRRLTGTQGEGMRALAALSPAHIAAQADAPVLLIHGKDDTVVPIEQSRIMETALKRAKKPVEFIAMEGEDHWLSRSKTRTQMLKASVEFVKKHNPPD
jgi:dipeptidyl aminopeptidase/acylaminoacyl peptidase